MQYPTPWSYSGPAAAALPTFDYSSYAEFTNTAKVARDGNIVWFPSSQVIDEYHFAATANAMNGSTSLTMPDLSAVGGFLASPASGTSVSWYAETTENSSGALAAMPSGATKPWVENAGTLIVPYAHSFWGIEIGAPSLTRVGNHEQRHLNRDASPKP